MLLIIKKDEDYRLVCRNYNSIAICYSKEHSCYIWCWSESGTPLEDEFDKDGIKKVILIPDILHQNWRMVHKDDLKQMREGV